LLVPNKTYSFKLSLFGTRAIIGHDTIGFTIYGFLYIRSIWTNRLPCTVVKIWCLKDFWVTTLAFLGYLTSLVTWPLDSQ